MATDNFVFIGGACKTVAKLSPVGGSKGFEQTVSAKLPGHAYSLAGDDEKLFALLHTNVMMQLDTDKLAKVNEWKCSYDATFMTWSKKSN